MKKKRIYNYKDMIEDMEESKK